MSNSLIPSFLMSDVSKSLRALTKNERCEPIAQVAHQKWATMSDSLRSLTKNERPWMNRSGCSPKMSEWANHSFFCKKRAIRSENRWANSQPWQKDIAPLPPHLSHPPSPGIKHDVCCRSACLPALLPAQQRTRHATRSVTEQIWLFLLHTVVNILVTVSALGLLIYLCWLKWCWTC